MAVCGKIVVGFGVLMVGVFARIYAGLIYLSPLPLHVIDRDSSGVVSPIEAMDANDVGRRPDSQDPDCVEFYWLKDATVAYVSCSGGR